MERFERYMYEAKRHIEAFKEAKEEIDNSFIQSSPTKLQKFALEVIVFRFSKLQDLLGSKLFRTFLERQGFTTEGKSYFELLKELEIEGILEIDKWAELRELRNEIAHEYEQEEEILLQKAQNIAREFSYLIEVVQRIERAAKKT
jgi:hypothetical protein